MIWLLATLIAGTGFATNILISKYIMKDVSSLNFSTIYCIIGSLFSLPVFIYFLFQGQASFTIYSVIALFSAAAASAGALLAINEAVKKGEVSLAYPLSRTEPVFALVFGFLVLGESLSVLKITGVLLATAGAYTVMLNRRMSIQEQIQVFRNNRAAHLGLFSAVLYAFAAIADKFAVRAINPTIYTFMLLFLMAIMYLGFNLFSRQSSTDEMVSDLRQYISEFVAVSLILVVSYYSFVKALSIAEASRVVPVIQVEILISVIGGHIFYNEENIREKLLGSLILISGIILVAAPKALK